MLNTFKLSSSQELLKYSLNKGTGVYSMVIYTVDINFYYLLPFFESPCGARTRVRKKKLVQA
jgi:hypothetical protein